jgi:hypothetical protein
VKESEVFHAGGMMFRPYKSGVPYKYPKSNVKAAHNPIVDKMIANLFALFCELITSNETTPARNKMLVAGDILPIGKLLSDPGEVPKMRSMPKGYPKRVSPKMKRQKIKVRINVICIIMSFLYFSNKLIAAAPVRIKHSAVLRAMGIEFSTIPASDKLLASHPAKAGTLIRITNRNAQSEILLCSVFIIKSVMDLIQFG